MFDAFKMLGKLNEVKAKTKQAREQISGIEIEEYSDDKMIRVIATGDKRILKIEIQENLFYPAAKSDLENRLIATINAALAKAEITAKEVMRKELEGVMPDIPGLDLGSLGL